MRLESRAVLGVAVGTLICVAAFALPEPTRQTPGDQDSVRATIAPFNSYGHVYDEDSLEAMRPRIMGTHGAVSTGHYLATTAGLETLKSGGNAFDAGVTAAMALKVTKMAYAGWTGVAPLILYSADEDRVVTRIGAGRSPALATLDHFLQHGKTAINTALVPADVDVWLAALERYGTISFATSARPALEIAENGYHLYKMQKWLIEEYTDDILQFPYNIDFWFQHGIGDQRLGDLMVNPDLGKLIRYMIDAEEKALAAGATRSAGIRAARDAFYKGDPARAVDRYFREQDGLVRYDDLASYEGGWMDPIHTAFMDHDVYVCDGWSQGPRLILFLNILENFDLRALGYNTPAYIHLISQAINLAMSDTHRYVGDPTLVDIPKNLYSKEYACRRAELIDMERAFDDMPPWGDPIEMVSVAGDAPRRFVVEASYLAESKPREPRPALDTTSLNVIDADGNLFSMTESDGHVDSPMIPGWGFGLGGRMGQFNLDPALANVMAPKKRPRNTNSPVLLMRDGAPFMGLSTPGGDQQMQALLQVILNVVVWEMSPEQALDQPRFGSYNFPATGSEINDNPAKLKVEDRIPAETVDALRNLGHDVELWGLWNWRAGAPTVAYSEPRSRVLIAAGDVRRETAALAY